MFSYCTNLYYRKICPPHVRRWAGLSAQTRKKILQLQILCTCSPLKPQTYNTSSRIGIWNPVRDLRWSYCVNSQCVKPVCCFCRGAPSLIFDGILNGTLSEEVSTPGVKQRNLEPPCLLILLIHTKYKSNKTKSWTDPTSSIPLRRTNPLGR